MTPKLLSARPFVDLRGPVERAAASALKQSIEDAKLEQRWRDNARFNALMADPILRRERRLQR